MKLTAEQIKNWRVVLSTTELGYMAFVIPAEYIEKFTEELQAQINQSASTFCDCDENYYGATVRLDGKVICHKCHKERAADGGEK